MNNQFSIINTNSNDNALNFGNITSLTELQDTSASNQSGGIQQVNNKNYAKAQQISPGAFRNSNIMKDFTPQVTKQKTYQAHQNHEERTDRQLTKGNFATKIGQKPTINRVAAMNVLQLNNQSYNQNQNQQEFPTDQNRSNQRSLSHSFEDSSKNFYDNGQANQQKQNQLMQNQYQISNKDKQSIEQQKKIRNQKRHYFQQNNEVGNLIMNQIQNSQKGSQQISQREQHSRQENSKGDPIVHASKDQQSANSKIRRPPLNSGILANVNIQNVSQYNTSSGKTNYGDNSFENKLNNQNSPSFFEKGKQHQSIFDDQGKKSQIQRPNLIENKGQGYDAMHFKASKSIFSSRINNQTRQLLQQIGPISEQNFEIQPSAIHESQQDQKPKGEVILHQSNHLSKCGQTVVMKNDQYNIPEQEIKNHQQYGKEVQPQKQGSQTIQNKNSQQLDKEYQNNDHIDSFELDAEHKYKDQKATQVSNNYLFVKQGVSNNQNHHPLKISQIQSKRNFDFQQRSLDKFENSSSKKNRKLTVITNTVEKQQLEINEVHQISQTGQNKSHRMQGKDDWTPPQQFSHPSNHIPGTPKQFKSDTSIQNTKQNFRKYKKAVNDPEDGTMNVLGQKRYQFGGHEDFQSILEKNRSQRIGTGLFSVRNNQTTDNQKIYNYQQTSLNLPSMMNSDKNTTAVGITAQLNSSQNTSNLGSAQLSMSNQESQFLNKQQQIQNTGHQQTSFIRKRKNSLFSNSIISAINPTENVIQDVNYTVKDSNKGQQIAWDVVFDHSNKKESGSRVNKTQVHTKSFKHQLLSKVQHNNYQFHPDRSQISNTTNPFNISQLQQSSHGNITEVLGTSLNAKGDSIQIIHKKKNKQPLQERKNTMQIPQQKSVQKMQTNEEAVKQRAIMRQHNMPNIKSNGILMKSPIKIQPGDSMTIENQNKHSHASQNKLQQQSSMINTASVLNNQNQLSANNQISYSGNGMINLKRSISKAANGKIQLRSTTKIQKKSVPNNLEKKQATLVQDIHSRNLIIPTETASNQVFNYVLSERSSFRPYMTQPPKNSDQNSKLQLRNIRHLSKNISQQQMPKRKKILELKSKYHKNFSMKSLKYDNKIKIPPQSQLQQQSFPSLPLSHSNQNQSDAILNKLRRENHIMTHISPKIDQKYKIISHSLQSQSVNQALGANCPKSISDYRTAGKNKNSSANSGVGNNPNVITNYAAKYQKFHQVNFANVIRSSIAKFEGTSSGDNSVSQQLLKYPDRGLSHKQIEEPKPQLYPMGGVFQFPIPKLQPFTVAQNAFMYQPQVMPQQIMMNNPIERQFQSPQLTKQISDPKIIEHGKIIRWREGEIIGLGSSSIVYSAIRVDNNCCIAVKKFKVVSDVSGIDQNKLKIIKNEIQKYKQLEHENVIKFHGCELLDQFFCIYFEQMETSLANLLSEYGYFEENYVRQYTKQILNGLSYLHEKKIKHLDLKCSNILRNNDQMIVKLCDFGSAREFKKSSQGGSQSAGGSSSFNSLQSQIVGSVQWMAPEVIKEEGCGSKSDIWSLGCTVVEMFVGGNPWGDQFDDQNLYQAQQIITNSEKFPQIPKTTLVSKECEDFLKQCFIRDYKQRPSAASLLKHAWLAES